MTGDKTVFLITTQAQLAAVSPNAALRIVTSSSDDPAPGLMRFDDKGDKLVVIYDHKASFLGFASSRSDLFFESRIFIPI